MFFQKNWSNQNKIKTHLLQAAQKSKSPSLIDQILSRISTIVQPPPINKKKIDPFQFKSREGTENEA